MNCPIVEVFDPVVAALVGIEDGDGLDRRPPVRAFRDVGNQREDLFRRSRYHPGDGNNMIDRESCAIHVDG